MYEHKMAGIDFRWQARLAASTESIRDSLGRRFRFDSNSSKWFG